MRRARAGLSLAGWVAVLAGVGGLAGPVVGLLVLLAAGGVDRAAAQALLAVAATGLVVAAAAVLLTSRVSRALRALHVDALRRLDDPAAPARVSTTARAAVELRELARVLEALHLRVRVADELGERHRRDAETASAGVFELLSGLVSAEEAARGQLAAELHDTVAQSLMLARGQLAAPALSADELARVVDYVEDAEEQVRGVMARTRPPALRDGDLACAVDRLRQDLDARYALRVELEWPAAGHPLPLASAITLYRFFQEALLNVVKHADVECAVATLVVEADEVVAQVRDAGPGFEPGAVQTVQGRHVGLGLMRERARLSGGAVTVDSVPGRGTTLTLRLPRPVAPVAGPVPAGPVPAGPAPGEVAPGGLVPNQRDAVAGTARALA